MSPRPYFGGTRSLISGKAPHMVVVQFEARVRADRLIGFYVPNSILPGQNCSFVVSMTQPSPPNGGASTLFGTCSFNQTIAADRHVVFTVPGSVPLGTF